MPISAKKPCSHPGCFILVHGVSRCEKHAAEHRRLSDQHRDSAAERGYGHKWRKAREGYLSKHSLCLMCDSNGFVEPSSVVDHIVPHRGNKELFWDKDNWQALCKSCHDKKTAREDGGFGRPGGGQKFVAFDL